MDNLFTKHPRSVGETYWQHLYYAGKMGLYLSLLSVAAITHAILPFLFETTTSRHISKLAVKIEERNKRRTHPSDD